MDFFTKKVLEIYYLNLTWFVNDSVDFFSPERSPWGKTDKIWKKICETEGQTIFRHNDCIT